MSVETLYSIATPILEWGIPLSFITLLLFSILGLAVIIDRAIALSTEKESKKMLQGLDSDGVESHAIKLRQKLESRLWLLFSVATLSPLVGLLGTVLGIMHSFSKLHTHGEEVITAVATGIWTALTTTAIGIIIAVPSAIMYNFYKKIVNNKVENFIALNLKKET